MHIQKIRGCDGGNEYKEGIQGFKRTWAGMRLKGKPSRLQHASSGQLEAQQHQASHNVDLSQGFESCSDDEEVNDGSEGGISGGDSLD